jgi:hypothetical protein
MELREPGWYDDGTGALRWWDGSAWSDAAPTPPPSASPVPTPDAGAQTTPASPHATRRRGPWIALGIAVGVILLAGIGVAVALLVPGWLSDPDAGAAAPSASVDAAASTEDEEPVDELLHPGEWDMTGPAIEPATDEERAAVAAFELYESSWEERDCDAYMESTTTSWRETLSIDDCNRFDQVSATLDGGDDVLTVALIKPTGEGRFTLGVVNTMPIEGEAAEGLGDDPVWRSLSSYHVRESQGEWRVDEVHDLEDGREEWQLAPSEEAEAAATISRWEDAIVGGDCDALLASTTAGFREGAGLADCAALQASIDERSVYCDMSMELIDSYYQTLWDMHHQEIIATVEESCLYLQDEDGNTLDPPEEGEPWPVEFHLVYDWDAGTWLIDNVG